MMAEPPVLPVYAIERHRLTSDGVGVTTLVGAYGCPLACKYCINPHAWNPKTISKCISMSCEELLNQVKIDHLYFLATGGGITFGGGESLLHTDFIRTFRQICPKEWSICVETSLNVSEEQFSKSLGIVNDYIVDIKDLNPDTYQAYTGTSIQSMLSNLSLLIKNVSPKHIKIRVPLIPGYNSKSDTLATKAILEKMGFTQIEVFPYVIKSNPLQTGL